MKSSNNRQNKMVFYRALLSGAAFLMLGVMLMRIYSGNDHFKQQSETIQALNIFMNEQRIPILETSADADGLLTIEVDSLSDEQYSMLAEHLRDRLQAFTVIHPTSESQQELMCFLHEKLNSALQAETTGLQKSFSLENSSHSVLLELLQHNTTCDPDATEPAAVLKGYSEYIAFGADERGILWWGIRNSPKEVLLPIISLRTLSQSPEQSSDDTSEPATAMHNRVIECSGGTFDPVYTLDKNVALGACEGGYAEIGDFWLPYTKVGFRGGIRFHMTGTEGAKAIWNFSGVGRGTYDVLITWPKFAGLSTDAPFSIYDGDRLLKTVLVNQELPLRKQILNFKDMNFEKHSWLRLGTFTTRTGTLRVELGTNASKEFVVADGVRLIVVD